MIYTDHAEERMQQRAIPELALELLERYGCIEHSHGACIRYFDRRGFKKVEKLVKRLSGELEKLSGMYFVETSEGVVVTAGHRTRQIKHAYKPHAKRRKRMASSTSIEPRRARHIPTVLTKVDPMSRTILVRI